MQEKRDVRHHQREGDDLDGSGGNGGGGGGSVSDNHRGVQIDGAVTSRGAGCCVAMVTANGPGRPLHEYIRPSATNGLEILLNFIYTVIFLFFSTTPSLRLSHPLSFSFSCMFSSWSSRILRKLTVSRTGPGKSGNEATSEWKISKRRRTMTNSQ